MNDMIVRKINSFERSILFIHLASSVELLSFMDDCVVLLDFRGQERNEVLSAKKKKRRL